jgi:hypothetical protein
MQSARKTQIYLSEAEYRAVGRRAAVERTSKAAVIREAVAAYLTTPPGGRGGRGAGRRPDPLLGIAGVADGSRRDSTRIDEILYGKP